MNNNNFRVIREMKDFILSLDKVVVNFPRSERVLRDNIYNDSYEALRNIVLANLLDSDKGYIQKKVIASLSMIDFYFEFSLKKKYISEKQCVYFCRKLQSISKMTYGWIKNG